MKELMNFDLNLHLDAYSEEKNPIQTAPNGVRYVDVPSTGFYAGTHKGFPYSTDHIQQLQDSFRHPIDDLRGPIPVMVDHSYSNHDKIGHLRSVATDGNYSRVVCRLVGEDAIKGLREGKFDTLSAGIIHEVLPKEQFSKKKDPDQDSEPDPEDPGEDSEDEEESYEDDPEESEMSDDEEEGEDMGGKFVRSDFSAKFRQIFESEPERVRIAYDHMAFTPFPALPDCKVHNDRSKKVSQAQPATPKKEAAKISVEEFAEIKRQNDELKAHLESERAARESERVASERKLAAFAKTEEYVVKGKVSPAQKGTVQALLASFSDAVQEEAFCTFLESLPAHAFTAGIQNTQVAIPPELQHPMGTPPGAMAALSTQGGAIAAEAARAEADRLARQYCTLADPRIYSQQ